MRKSIIAALTAAAALMVAAAATAEVKWTLQSGAAGCNTTGSTFGNSRICPADSGPVNNATATAWSFTGDNGGADTKLQDAYLGVYTGGVGVTNRDGDDRNASPACATGQDCEEGTPTATNAPEHAVDNNQKFDAVLISFQTAVTLSRVEFGYAPGDADFTLLAYTGGFTPNLLNQTAAQLLGAANAMGQGGWTPIADYDTSGTGSKNVNAGLTSSTHWLVSAYNPAFGAGNVPTGGTFDSGDDIFKLKLVATRDPQVPEPGTLLLLGVAALAFWRSRSTR